MPAAEEVKYGLDLSAADPADLGRALAAAALQTAREPAKAARAAAELAVAQTTVGLDVLRHVLNGAGDDTDRALAADPRFADRAWRDNPFLRAVASGYLASADAAQRLLESLDLPEQRRRKARFALGVVLDALAPSNAPLVNPAVVKEAIDTGGLNFARGFANFVDDVVHHGGLPREVDTSGYELGRNLAATNGRVVFRNELIELLAYEPVTETVFARPVLYVPSWINKYYVLDLAPGRSFVEHAVGQGFTVFAVSWRNPDASMADLTLDDYFRDGLIAALERTSELTGSESVNLLAVCVGGTLTAIALAVLAARGEAARVASATLLNTLVDYSDPGDIAVFTDEATIERIERRMRSRGYLEPQALSGPFTWMKGSDLVWRYVVWNWYLGRQPPAFDVLAWNADSTRLPAAMHSQFLRACYLENRLVRPGTLVIDGTPVDLGAIETPVYVLASENDHIAPWRSAYRTMQLVGGETRFVLTSGGHIVGMVNPPGNPKAFFRTRPDAPPDADEWLAGAERVDRSWWEDWATWAGELSGERVGPPELPPGEPAPGRYVFG